MPMVYVIEPEFGDCANWLVDDVAMGCEECRDLVNEIVRKYSFQYDIFDPTCTPVPAARNMASPASSRHPPRLAPGPRTGPPGKGSRIWYAPI